MAEGESSLLQFGSGSFQKVDLSQVRRQDVIELALLFILITVFATVVTAFVRDLIVPPLRVLIDFPDYEIILRHASPEHRAIAIPLGKFLETIITAIVIGSVVLLVLLKMNKPRNSSR